MEVGNGSPVRRKRTHDPIPLLKVLHRVTHFDHFARPFVAHDEARAAGLMPTEDV